MNPEAAQRYPPGDLAVWVFILAELLVFALFFTAYAFARLQDLELINEFQQHLDRRSAFINTLALITSSYFVVPQLPPFARMAVVPVYVGCWRLVMGGIFAN